MGKRGSDGGDDRGGKRARASRPDPADRELRTTLRRQKFDPARAGMPTRHHARMMDAITGAIGGDGVADVRLLKAAMEHRGLARLEPPKFAGGDKIWDGVRKAFRKDFFDKFWKDNGHKPCYLGRCGNKGPIPKHKREIEHVKPWTEVVYELEPIDVCYRGKHWRVITEKAMYKMYQMDANLKPACSSCNASKGGVKGRDLMRPQVIGECPGYDDCDLMRGT